MNRETLFEEITAAVRAEVELFSEGSMQVELCDVVKINDETLHGISLRAEGFQAAPTVYLEHFMGDYEKGMSVKSIAEKITFAMTSGMLAAPELGGVSFEYGDIENSLVVQVVDAANNRKRLRNLVYRPLENGFAMIPYVVLDESERGCLSAPVSKGMAEAYGYDIDRLIDTAEANTRERYQPAFTDMFGMLTDIDGARKTSNLMREDFCISPSEEMYVLTNSTGINGAGVLFYPGVQERIGELLGDNYYVLPSSLHEVIIVPEKKSPGTEVLHSLVKQTNATVVDKSELLSDRVLLFDREKSRLIDTTPHEKNRWDRNER